MAKQKQENPAQFIARYIEEGLRKEKGIVVSVKKVQVTVDSPKGAFMLIWDEPFTEITSTKRKTRIIETEKP